MSHFWLSYDLGVQGDYENLYKWLDSNSAKECGDSIAYIKKYKKLSSNESIADTVKKDLKSNVDFGKKDRVYLIFQDNDGNTKGRFIIGNRKASPWEGYASNKDEDDF